MRQTAASRVKRGAPRQISPTGQGSIFRAWHRAKAHAAGDVTLTFDYAIECEPGFDYAYVFVDTMGSPPDQAYGSQLMAYTGAQGGTDPRR